MRKLATVRKVNEIIPIEGADAIVVAVVDGWKIVVKKDEFKVDDNCIYFEIDSFLPCIPEFEFLRTRSFKRMGELEGYRLRTIKLRGQISQGLLLPISVFPEVVNAFHKTRLYDPENPHMDVSELLGVQKYEPPIPAALSGNVRGNFPSFIRKTDQERCQNLGADIFVANKDSKYEVTLKMDGTSFTCFYVDKEEGVCGRNWELQVNESNEGNSLVRMYVDSKLQQVLRNYGRNIAVQGELQGPSIQGNKEGLKAHMLFVFDMYDIDRGEYIDSDTRVGIMRDLVNLGLDINMVQHVPIMSVGVTLSDLGINNMNELLEYAKGPSLYAKVREGLVFKRMDGKFSFKTINNDWLLKNE